MCCPMLHYGHCLVAIAMRMCQESGDGKCVVIKSRCCGVIEIVDGRVIPEWETCRLYLWHADCRYCQHYDKNRNWCRHFNKPVRYYIGLCTVYNGPRPIPSIIKLKMQQRGGME